MDTTNNNYKMTLAESLLKEYTSKDDLAIVEQIKQFRNIYSIYERTQIILGRKALYRTCNNSTEEVILNFSNIGSTKTNISNNSGLA